MVTCPQCNVNMQQGSLQRHLETIHNKSIQRCLCREAAPMVLFQVTITQGVFNACPVPGCIGGGKDLLTMHCHFSFRHAKSELSIDGEGHKRCQTCGMFTANAETHPQTATCTAVTRWRCNTEMSEEQVAAEHVDFWLDGGTIERVERFCYLGRVLADKDDDSPYVNKQLCRTRQRWAHIANILKSEGANARAMAIFYPTIVQAVLLYGAEL